MLAVDVSPWLRSDALSGPDRLFCHVDGRGKGQAQLIPGWPYSFVAALEPGRTSWTALLDAVRLGPADDATAVTADQLRAVIGRLITVGQWRAGDPPVLIVAEPATTSPGSPTYWPTCPSNSSAGCAPTESCGYQNHPDSPGPSGARPSTAPRSPWTTRQLAGTAAHHQHRHQPLRHRHRHQLGPRASPAHPPGLLDRP